MVERVELEPTMEEIVVALRETRRGVDRAPPFTVVGRQPGGNWASGMATCGGKGGAARGRGTAVDAQNAAGSTDIAALRDREIERLLIENAHLNERVVFLLKVIEREQACNIESEAEHAAIETDRGALGRDVRAALEAELRPVLLVLLRLLERQRSDPAEEGARRAGPEAARLATPIAASPDWVVDVGRKLDGEGEALARNQVGAPAGAMPSPQPKLHQRMAHVLDTKRI